MSEKIEILTANESKELDTVDEFTNYDPLDDLKPRQMMFVELYLTGDKGIRYNACQSYSVAYDNPNMMTCKTAGGKMLQRPAIRKYQRFITNITGFNDESVDNKLKELIFNSHGRDAVVAIREYNRVKGRIVNKSVNTTVDANKLLDQLQGDNDADDY